MYIVKNPAKSRPLSANVRRLMKMARESPLNPNVEKIEREFTARDLAYCDMQGNIFMAAIDQGISSVESHSRSSASTAAINSSRVTSYISLSLLLIPASCQLLTGLVPWSGGLMDIL